MRNSELYALVAKLVLKGGYDFERDNDFTADERGYIRQGLNDLAFFQPGFKEKIASLSAGAKRVANGKAERVKESDNSPKASN